MLKKFIALLPLILVAGCSGPMMHPLNISTLPEEQAFQPALDKSRYILQLGDEIEVKFYYQADLNEYQAIRPDGKISLQLINNIQAAGLTTEELSKNITNKYRNILRRPEATVIIKKHVKAKVFIGGKVEHPGIMEVDSTLTLLQGIFQAGGFLDSAEMRSVLLIRRESNYLKPKIYSLNMEEPANDLLLNPYDIVYVPPSTISQVDAFVEKYITKIIPVSFSVSYYLNSVLTPGQ